MKRLRVSVRALSAVLVALAARMIIDGPTPLTAVTTAIISALLLAFLALSRQGHRLEPAPYPQHADRPVSPRQQM